MEQALDLCKAVEFVRRTGNEVEQARLNYLLTNEHPTQDVVDKLFSGQRSDGGWSPFWAQDYSSLDATCFRLAQAEQMGLLGSETAIVRALSFLTQRQSPDGSWEEDKRIANFAPTWARPGDLSSRLYLTANCGFWLALIGDIDRAALKAANYLQLHLDQDGHIPSFLHAHWLAGGLWYKLNRHKSAERVFEYLDRRMTDLAASNLSWLITTVCAAGSPPHHPMVNKAASLLAQSQQDDGRWLSEDGPGQDVHSTLEALRALWLCGRIIKLAPTNLVDNTALASALCWASSLFAGHTDRPQVEAELLLAHLLDQPRTYLYAHPEALLTSEQATTYTQWVERRTAGEPLPYITGQIEFFGLTFAVTPDVLIPRPETETLVEAALDWLKAHPVTTAVDVGTGSGCIAVTLAVHAPALRLYATDISRAALDIARTNAERHNVVDRITFIEGDLLRPLHEPVDLVVSNPPYIAEREWDALPLSVRQEPQLALLAGADGLDTIRRLLTQAQARLRPGGLMLVEIGERQGEAARALAQAAFSKADVSILPDLAGKDRVLKIVR